MRRAKRDKSNYLEETQDIKLKENDIEVSEIESLLIKSDAKSIV